jgi:hypothetical protein
VRRRGHDWQGVAGAGVDRWTVDCGAAGLESAEISIGGLELTLTDVLLRVEWRDGSRFSSVLRPDAPAVRAGRGTGAGKATVPRRGSCGSASSTSWAGSITCCSCSAWCSWSTAQRRPAGHHHRVHAGALDHARAGDAGRGAVPSRPVEASIALSIVLLSVELVRRWRGDAEGTTVRRPWLVSFAFGLLHGLGFAARWRDRAAAERHPARAVPVQRRASRWGRSPSSRPCSRSSPPAGS